MASAEPSRVESVTMVTYSSDAFEGSELHQPIANRGLSSEHSLTATGPHEVDDRASLPSQPLLVGALDDDTEQLVTEAAPRRSVGGWLSENIGKGEVSNMIALVVMVVGIVLTETVEEKPDSKIWYTFRCIRALGLFGFSGGVTNWLAVKMLFDRIPLLIGSGVITRRFQEIRETIKQVILDTIFEPEAMQQYIDQRTGSFLSGFNLEEQIQSIMQSDVVDAVIDKKIAELMARPEGLMFAMMGVDAVKLKGLVKPFVFGLGVELAPMLVKVLDSMDLINGYRIREQVEAMMSNRLQEFTPPKVKELVEKMIRKHLGWLVVWGNALGALVGLITELISIYA